MNTYRVLVTLSVLFLVTLCITLAGCIVSVPGLPLYKMYGLPHTTERVALAARRGEDELQRSLAATGIDINLVTAQIGSVLTWAIWQDKPTLNDDIDVARAIELIVAAGAEVNYSFDSPVMPPPIVAAAQHNSSAATIALIEAGADVNVIHNGKSPLDWAVDRCVRREYIEPDSRSRSLSDPGTAAIIAIAGGRLNAPMVLKDVLLRRWAQPDFYVGEDPALAEKAMDRCYPPGIEWE